MANWLAIVTGIFLGLIGISFLIKSLMTGNYTYLIGGTLSLAVGIFGAWRWGINNE